MARKYFGTDGIRGKANEGNMTAEVAMRVGMAAAKHFLRGDHQHRVVIGKDTRLSGYMLEPALTAGFISLGMDVIMVGPMPTPAVAMLTRSLRADLGVMISASHNPFFDNGLKLFGPDGNKLSDEIELEIERRMDNGYADNLVPSEKLGRAQRLHNAVGRYIEFAKNTFPKNQRLDGLKIVLDCANGAAYRSAPSVLWELGAEVVALGVEPNGKNINDKCGSTHPELMCENVVLHGADIGIALDGDADRLIVCDEHGQIIDGDQLMATVATHLKDIGELRGNALAATVMSNLGLEKYLESIGIELVRTQVGDRYVVAAMREKGLNLGGEQSGHIVLSDYATTGDGLIAALQILSVLVSTGKPVSDICNLYTAYPQLLKNTRYMAGTDPLMQKSVIAAIEAGEARLKDTGRVLIRKSGTEPVIRVMAEGQDETLITAVVDDIIASIEELQLKKTG
ncbi:phosphoglucosamine mutase [Paremcibacter congregatus]|uniref:Phosphoglucosamine mutase n=1 Tax=Paremcibacter congregatus TaxID=2043170 RepID=A0A2G4YTT9_9PROT|nr:phosphoglucosamine mutase [Paremcibacter congregatus]PHZ85759.1 phosphoglucosamine mutase [Paremcibacter congregatus]QDE26720.1 phosphoglucosamine mutase [Paremcibacter congregatus]|tara:strand:+ start:127 stop:1488 length:1362 start_codon:yes stop_codon:yes gene_type:complete